VWEVMTDLESWWVATFPRGLVRCAAEWVFTRLLNGIAEDREHARLELQYPRHILEPAKGRPAGDAVDP